MNIEIENKRNPCILFKDSSGNVVSKILCIGDPHLGRTFRTGVPSHRLGERESHQFSTFSELLSSKDPLVKAVVILGDLFDKFVVSPTVVYDTHYYIKEAVLKNPGIQYSLIPGNHDLSKDSFKKSSYELLCIALSGLEDVVTNLTTILYSTSYDIIEIDSNTRFYLNLVAYSPFNNTMWDEDIEHEVFNTDPLNRGVISFGHFDSLSILDSGYTPTQELLDKSLFVVSGHEHVYKQYTYPYDKNKTLVIFTGSMEPYSHAEDPDKSLYITIDSDKLDTIELEGLKYHNVRLYCEPNFKLKEAIDCFSLSFMVKETEHEELSEEEVQLLDSSYQSNMLSYFDTLGDDFSESLRSIFISKDY